MNDRVVQVGVVNALVWLTVLLSWALSRSRRTDQTKAGSWCFRLAARIGAVEDWRVEFDGPETTQREPVDMDLR